MEKERTGDALEELNEQEIKKASGGYYVIGRNGRKFVRCNKCNWGGGLPISKGHLCLRCLKELKQKLGREHFFEFLLKNYNF